MQVVINGSEGFYTISDKGDVYSYFTPLIKKLKTRLRRGYESLTLRLNEVRKDYSIHVLVAEHFIGPRPDGFQVNHIDGNKINNNVTNLEYVTQSENMKHAFRLGLQCNKGENHSQSKLTELDIIKIRRMRKMGMTYLKISEYFCVTGLTIGKICRGERWSHVKEEV